MQSGKLRKCKRRNKKHPVKGESGWVTFMEYFDTKFYASPLPAGNGLIMPNAPSGILTAKSIREAVAKMKAMTI